MVGVAQPLGERDVSGGSRLSLPRPAARVDQKVAPVFVLSLRCVPFAACTSSLAGRDLGRMSFPRKS